jgi:phosphatidylinositol glycan class N
VTSTILPLLALRSRQHYMQRLLVLVFSFAPVFVILSISYETLFYFAFSVTLLLSLVLETKLSEFRRDKAKRVTALETEDLRSEHLRIALCFLFFIHVGFFGTGYVALLFPIVPVVKCGLLTNRPK